MAFVSSRDRNNRRAFDYNSWRSNLHDDYDDPPVHSAVLRRLRDMAGHRRSHLRPSNSIWIFRYWQRPCETCVAQNTDTSLTLIPIL